MTEAQMQSEIAIWFWNTYPAYRRMLIMVDNNSYNAIEGARKKAMGVVRGVSDLILIVDHMTYFIELKLPGQKQKPEQVEFMRKVLWLHHPYLIFYSVEQFKQFIWQTIGR